MNQKRLIPSKSILSSWLFLFLVLLFIKNEAIAVNLSNSLKETGQEGNLTFMLYGTEEYQNQLNDILYQFQKKHDIGLKMIYTENWNYLEKLKTLMAGGQAPDVFAVNTAFFSELAFSKELMALDSYIQKSTLDTRDFFSELIKACKYEESLYALPLEWSPFVLFYNKSVFDQAGLPYPDSNWTWNTVADTAEILTKINPENGQPLRYGFIVETWSDWYYNWILQNNGALFDDQGRWVFGDEQYLHKNAAALQFLYSFIKKKTSPEFSVLFQEGIFRIFYNGQAAMFISGHWIMPNLSVISNVQWDYSVLPYQKKRATVFHLTGLAMSSHVKDPHSAWKLIEFLTGTEAQIMNTKSGQSIPSRKSAVQSDAYLKNPLFMKNQPYLMKQKAEDDPFIQSLSYIYPLPLSTRWTSIRKHMDEQLEDVFLGNKKAMNVIPLLNKIIIETLEDDLMLSQEGYEE